MEVTMLRQMQPITYVYRTPQNYLKAITACAKVGIQGDLKYCADLEFYWAVFNKHRFLGDVVSAFAYDADAEQWSPVIQDNEPNEVFDGSYRDEWVQFHDEKSINRQMYAPATEEAA
jgi:hypothetical protein